MSATRNGDHIFTRSDKRHKPRYERWSITRLKDELSLNEHLLVSLGHKLSDGGERLEYTIAVLKKEIARAEKEIEDLSDSLAGMRGPSTDPLLKSVAPRRQRERSKGSNTNAQNASDSKSDSHKKEVSSISEWAQADYEAKMRAYRKDKRRLFRPPPPLARVSLDESARIMEEEQRRSMEYFREHNTLDVKHNPETPPIQADQFHSDTQQSQMKPVLANDGGQVQGNLRHDRSMNAEIGDVARAETDQKHQSPMRQMNNEED
mmetsp:Transcript_9856/g.13724  ORF Transcript_9856/g.13724 Transcript_9856/m.13724 type:complete len:262 (-) Transcript_9856:47-832(-)